MSIIACHMRESLREHVLEQILDTEKFKAFYIKQPGQGRMMSTLILFTPEGIVLQGDLTPSRNGNVSCLGYGLSWFSSKLGEDYLCSKFLDRVFVAEHAVSNIRYFILQERREGSLSKDRARELWDSCPRADEVDARAASEFWTDEMHMDGADCPFYTYEPGAAGWLCAIQQTFARLFNEQRTSVA